MYNDITAIILAGGKSLRMGENKALLQLNGKSIIMHISHLMLTLFQRVILITNDPDKYDFLGLESYKDIYPGKGPLGGIHAGLKYSKTEKNFIVSCDIPLVTGELIKFLTEYETIQPVTIARAEEYIQQLCGIYNKSVLDEADHMLCTDSTEVSGVRKSKCRVLSLIEKTGAEIIESYDIPCYTEGMFLNMNKPDDYRILLEMKLSPH